VKKQRKSIQPVYSSTLEEVMKLEIRVSEVERELLHFKQEVRNLQSQNISMHGRYCNESGGTSIQAPNFRLRQGRGENMALDFALRYSASPSSEGRNEDVAVTTKKTDSGEEVIRNYAKDGGGNNEVQSINLYSSNR
jgi:hypothetical protein